MINYFLLGLVCLFMSVLSRAQNENESGLNWKSRFHQSDSLEKYPLFWVENNVFGTPENKIDNVLVIEDSTAYESFMNMYFLSNRTNSAGSVDFKKENVVIRYVCIQCLNTCSYPGCHRNACMFTYSAWKIPKKK